MSLRTTATMTIVAGAMAFAAHAAVPEPWDIAAVVLASISGGVSLAAYAAAVTNGRQIASGPFARGTYTKS